MRFVNSASRLAVNVGGMLGHPLVAVLLDCAVLGCVVVSSCMGIHESCQDMCKQGRILCLADLPYQPAQNCLAAEHQATHNLPVQGDALPVAESCRLWHHVPARSCWPPPGGLLAVPTLLLACAVLVLWLEALVPAPLPWLCVASASPEPLPWEP